MSLKFGFAQGNITPEPGHIYLDGYGMRLKPAEGVHDDIYVKVCVIDDNGELFALTSFDILGFTEDVEDVLIGHISTLSGIARERIALTATHTHSSISCGTLGSTPVNLMVWDAVGEIAGNAVKDAIANLEECTIKSAMGKELQYIHNRRGVEDMCDRRVHVLTVKNNAGEIKGVITSASCHAVVRTDYNISADFPGVLTREAAKKYPGVPFLFLQGRCADTNPLYMDDNKIDEYCEKLGMELVESVLPVVDTGCEVDTSKMSSQFIETKLPVRDYPDEKTLREKIKTLSDKYHASDKPVGKRIIARELTWCEKALRYVLRGEVNRPMYAPLQTLKLGDDLVFVMMPFETLKKTGDTLEEMLLERGYKSENIFVVGHSNCVWGYLIPKAYMPENMPNSPWIYEVTEAPYWYDVPFFSLETEDFVVNKMTELVDM